MSPAAIGRLIFSLMLRRLEVTAISSSAHADPICGAQTCCFLLTRLHGLPIALLNEPKRQHAFAPLARITSVNDRTASEANSTASRDKPGSS
jgi:hypothetical protein